MSQRVTPTGFICTTFYVYTVVCSRSLGGEVSRGQAVRACQDPARGRGVTPDAQDWYHTLSPSSRHPLMSGSGPVFSFPTQESSFLPTAALSACGTVADMDSASSGVASKWPGSLQPGFPHAPARLYAETCILLTSLAWANLLCGSHQFKPIIAAPMIELLRGGGYTTPDMWFVFSCECRPLGTSAQLALPRAPATERRQCGSAPPGHTHKAAAAGPQLRGRHTQSRGSWAAAPLPPRICWPAAQAVADAGTAGSSSAVAVAAARWRCAVGAARQRAAWPRLWREHCRPPARRAEAPRGGPPGPTWSRSVLGGLRGLRACVVFLFGRFWSRAVLGSNLTSMHGHRSHAGGARRARRQRLRPGVAARRARVSAGRGGRCRTVAPKYGGQNQADAQTGKDVQAAVPSTLGRLRLDRAASHLGGRPARFDNVRARLEPPRPGDPPSSQTLVVKARANWEGDCAIWLVLGTHRAAITGLSLSGDIIVEFVGLRSLHGRPADGLRLFFANLPELSLDVQSKGAFLGTLLDMMDLRDKLQSAVLQGIERSCVLPNGLGVPLDPAVDALGVARPSPEGLLRLTVLQVKGVGGPGDGSPGAGLTVEARAGALRSRARLAPGGAPTALAPLLVSAAAHQHVTVAFAAPRRSAGWARFRAADALQWASQRKVFELADGEGAQGSSGKVALRAEWAPLLHETAGDAGGGLALLRAGVVCASGGAPLADPGAQCWATVRCSSAEPSTGGEETWSTSLAAPSREPAWPPGAGPAGGGGERLQVRWQEGSDFVVSAPGSAVAHFEVWRQAPGGKKRSLGSCSVGGLRVGLAAAGQPCPATTPEGAVLAAPGGVFRGAVPLRGGEDPARVDLEVSLVLLPFAAFGAAAAGGASRPGSGRPKSADRKKKAKAAPGTEKEEVPLEKIWTQGAQGWLDAGAALASGALDATVGAASARFQGSPAQSTSSRTGSPTRRTEARKAKGLTVKE
ncbi:unnamed protein product [Prorocentrum cordatum]|uniref:Uncharacterized protein n=1 Tax=Prorocentrum cordatum TaxID=2364126 RepID=A0ABN9T829_9DINO|nr:unnamed protein product [Polarella glacialis]